VVADTRDARVGACCWIGSGVYGSADGSLQQGGWTGDRTSEKVLEAVRGAGRRDEGGGRERWRVESGWGMCGRLWGLAGSSKAGATG